MNSQMVEDVKDMALKLDEIRSRCPEEYFYLKGWIHCLLEMEGNTDQRSDMPPVELAQKQV